jgi:hypothetical protein
MNRFRSLTRDFLQAHLSPFHFDGRSGYLLREEEQILHSISMRAPLQDVLNGICGALDGQLGSVITFISFPWEDERELSSIALKAAQFGMSNYCTQGVFSESSEPLGYLEIYSFDRRSPSASEFQLIERAICLAAIAIKLEYDSKRQPGSDEVKSTTIPEGFYPNSDLIN